MKPTINDIARMTGKHRSTVARALREDTQHLISESCRKTIQEAATKLRYAPRHSARSLATGKSYCVGAVLGSPEKDLSSPMHARMFLEMTRTLLRSEYHLMFLPPDRGQSKQEHVRQALRRGRVDGLFIGSRMINNKMLDEIMRLRMPVVTTEAYRSVRESGRVSVVNRDHRPGIRAMMQALFDHGHRRVAYVLPDNILRHPYYARRAKLVPKLAAEAGVIINESDVIVYKPAIQGYLADRGEARQAAAARMNELRRYSAVIAHSDLVAYGIMDAMRDVGIKPGQDLGLAAFDNIEASPNYRVKDPFLATVDANFQLRGRRVAELLLERMEDPQAPVRIAKVPTRFIARPSLTGCTRPEISPEHEQAGSSVNVDV